jgi:hypothetical protein
MGNLEQFDPTRPERHNYRWGTPGRNEADRRGWEDAGHAVTKSLLPLALFLLLAAIPIWVLETYNYAAESVGVSGAVSGVLFLVLIAALTVVSNKAGGAFIFMMGISMFALSCSGAISGSDRNNLLLKLGLAVAFVIVGLRLFRKGRWWSLPSRKSAA